MELILKSNLTQLHSVRKTTSVIANFVLFVSRLSMKLISWTVVRAKDGYVLSARAFAFVPDV